MVSWDDLQSFLAIARHGNLSAAARALKVTQSTMGRRLAAFQDRAGAELLQRTSEGFVLTPAGERVLANVERMEEEALSVERSIAGEDLRLDGVVRITSVEAFAARMLVPIVATLGTRHPGISVSLDTDNRSLSLSRREADIAIRLAQFEQHDAIVRKAADMRFALYASKEYLAGRGAPDLVAGSPGHALITMQEDLLGLPEARWLAEITHAAMPSVASNSRQVQLFAALDGLGLACLPRYLADTHPRLERIPTADPPMREIWIGVHRDAKRVPRIRAVIDHVTAGLKRAAGILDPDIS